MSYEGGMYVWGRAKRSTHDAEVEGGGKVWSDDRYICGELARSVSTAVYGAIEKAVELYETQENKKIRRDDCW